MIMNRRDILKILLSVPIVASMPAIALEKLAIETGETAITESPASRFVTQVNISGTCEESENDKWARFVLGRDSLNPFIIQSIHTYGGSFHLVLPLYESLVFPPGASPYVECSEKDIDWQLVMIGTSGHLEVVGSRGGEEYSIRVELPDNQRPDHD